MKFTKEQFSEALKSKLTTNGKKLSQSEQTFSKSVERLYKRLEKSENDEELNDVVAEYLPDFEEIEGQLRHDHSEFIKEWEKKNPKPNDEHNNEPPKDHDTTTGQLQAMQKQLAELLNKQKEAETAQAVAAKKSAIVSKLKEKNVTDNEWVNAQMELIAISADTDVDAMTDKVVGLYNKLNAGGGEHSTPKGAGGGGPAEADFSDVVAKMKRSRGETE